MTDETQGLEPAEDAPVLPVETPVADSSAAPQETVSPPKADDEQPRDEDGKYLSRNAQKRIDELTWRAAENERQAAYWRDLASRAQEPKAPPPEAKLPSLESVGYDEAKYQAALIEYATQHAERAVEERLSKRDAEQRERSRLESFATRQREFAKATPDFETKVLRDPTLPITEAMRDVIVDSDAGPELAYYLANHREQADAIARLPAHLAARELGRIEERLEANKRPKATPQVTKAPPPPPKVDDVETPIASAKASDPESDKIDQREWFRLREKELKRRKG
jgi:hypothetical protein